MRLARILAAVFVFVLAASAHAQTATRTQKMARVGIFFTSPPRPELLEYEKNFVEAMRELGWVEGKNISYERAYTDKELQTLELKRPHAAALIRRKPDVIWTSSTNNARALQTETQTIPIVGAAVSDPVENGLAVSLAKPGRNFTGVTNIGWELGPKRLEKLKELMPKLTRVGVLTLPGDDETNFSKMELTLIRKAGGQRVSVVEAEMKDPKTVDEALVNANEAIGELVKHQVQAVMIPHVPTFQRYNRQIIQAAASRNIAVVGHRPIFADSGAVLSYSSSLKEQLRTSAHHVDKILNGTPPSVLPIERPTKFELVINQKTAKTLGLTVPQSLLVQADRIIQ